MSAVFHNCIDSSDKYDSRNDQMKSDGGGWQSGGTFLLVTFDDKMNFSCSRH